MVMMKNCLKHAIIITTVLLFLFAPFSSIVNHRAFAHGGEVEVVELESALEGTDATIKSNFWSIFTNTTTIEKDDTVIKIKPNSNIATVNGKEIELETPVTEKEGKIFVSHHFINEVFPELEQTFQIEKGDHPLDPLTPKEIENTVSVLKKSGKYKESLRFTEITLKLPEKKKVWDWTLSNEKKETFARIAEFIALDGKQVIEGEVDLSIKKLVSWNKIDGVHGMVIIDDFATVQTAIESSEEYIKALKKRDIEDVKKVVTTPLTVGYFDGEDGLEHEQRLLKVVSYLNTGDGNFWAHPIENLVATVDLEQKKVIKVEDEGVIPVPMQLNAYDGRDYKDKVEVKPLNLTEPDGKNYEIKGNTISWQEWDFHLRMDTRVGPVLSTVTYNDEGKKRKIMYEGSLGGMIVPYGDPDVGWYFKSYLDAGDYGMGQLTAPFEKGTDVPENAVLLDATIADNAGKPYTIKNAMAVFERYAGPEYKHADLATFTEENQSRERRELVMRWVSTIGNYDYIFDWVLSQNGTIKIDVGASGIEAVKGVKTKTMHDETAKEDTKYGTLLDNNIVGTTHQHIYNFRLDLDVDGEDNTLTEINPIVEENKDGGPRKSVMVTEQKTVTTEQEAIQKSDPSMIRLLSNYNKENKVGNPVSYQIIPFAGGTHPIAKGALFSEDDWLLNRVNFMDKQIWVTNYDPNERYPEGKYPNRSKTDTGLKQYTADNSSIENTDNVVWMTTGATHVARAEEWPMMPTEWVHAMLKPWNFFDRTPTLDLPKK
ncbi:stalk domain-containing protein [Metabacillus litoralis]|jgi:primary-amine oxidase|uniref:copper amine oxidase n=1 Tax=Metabacillus litoralis TaxID=152268 RepID=UPI0020404015|nr:stalk domain-containing protein [Metabacillus litoralis]MCM3653736.1 stalk domain-containing protein [Metabacillus litoralis]